MVLCSDHSCLSIPHDDDGLCVCTCCDEQIVQLVARDFAQVDVTWRKCLEHKAQEGEKAWRDMLRLINHHLDKAHVFGMDGDLEIRTTFLTLWARGPHADLEELGNTLARVVSCATSAGVAPRTCLDLLGRVQENLGDDDVTTLEAVTKTFQVRTWHDVHVHVY